MSMPPEAEAEYAFAAPPGFSIPEDVQEGQPFEVVAKIRLSNGQLMFDEINGVKLQDQPEIDEDEPQEWQDESGGDPGDDTAASDAVTEGVGL